MDRIVVGVDGSEGSRQALQWAIDEARLRKASLEIVGVYGLPLPPDGMVGMPLAQEVVEAPRKAAETMLQELGSGVEGLPVEQVAIESANPAHALVEHAEGAAMLVVSARGLGPFRRLILGSVSHQVALHATCPVVIVRHEQD